MEFLNNIKGWLSPDAEEEIGGEDISSREDTERRSYRESSTTESSGRKNKVVNIHATTQLQVILVKPERVAEATTITDYLLEKKTVVLNLESTDRSVARRLTDFLGGAAYAIGGQLKKVANNTYLITPTNVDIMGDLLLDELESNGMF